jgi:electron transfer flavoprotein alpha subunit
VLDRLAVCRRGVNITAEHAEDAEKAEFLKVFLSDLGVLCGASLHSDKLLEARVPKLHGGIFKRWLEVSGWRNEADPRRVVYGGLSMELDYLQALMGGTLEESPSAPYRDIWVVAEIRGGALANITKEMLGRARELADLLGVHVATVLIGRGVSAPATESIAHGSDVVYVADAPILADYRVEAFVKVLADLIQEKKPEIVLLGATARGRDLAPRLATRLKTGLISECVALDLDESERLLLGTRATHNGLMLATTVCPAAKPQIATVRPGCLRALAADRYRSGTTEQVALSVSESDVISLIEPATVPVRHVPLIDANIIVAGGRGMGGAEGFKLLEQLADLLGGEVAASRSAVEFGWAPRERMVDVTGNAVHPDLYIAVGISGAFPHRMATRGTRCLVAINKDSKAPIMRRADYAIAGDWRTIVPELILAVKEAQER